MVKLNRGDVVIMTKRTLAVCFMKQLFLFQRRYSFACSAHQSLLEGKLLRSQYHERPALAKPGPIHVPVYELA